MAKQYKKDHSIPYAYCRIHKLITLLHHSKDSLYFPNIMETDLFRSHMHIRHTISELNTTVHKKKNSGILVHKYLQ